MIAQAVATARAAGVTGQILVRGDSAYGNGVVVAACRRAGARFSLVLTKNRCGGRRHRGDRRATPGPRCPTRVRSVIPTPGNGSLMPKSPKPLYTAFASTPHAVTARLIVRRVKDARYPDALFPVWRYHPFFTDTDEPTACRRYHPPPPRHHRNRVRRPHRRTPGAHALGTLRRQLGLDPVRRDRPQPAARRRRAGRRRPRRRPRGHPAPAHRQHPRPPGPTPTPTDPAPTHALALGTAWTALWHNTIGLQPTPRPVTT